MRRPLAKFGPAFEKAKNYRYFNFLAENLEKLRSTELYGATLEDRHIFFVAALWAVRQWKAVN